MSRDATWITEPFQELVEHYGGTYVGIANWRVMAVGEGADEVADKRQRSCWTRWRNATPVDTSWLPNNAGRVFITT
jgi:hypothetical protein